MDSEVIVKRALNIMVADGLGHYFKDNKVVFNTLKTPNPPWRHFGRDYRMKCTYWKWVIYKGVVELTPGVDFVPSKCHDCYKIVVVPRSYHELKDLEQLMLKICGVDFAAKCGIERRETVDRNYGGYFYCRGKEEADERFEMIRDMVNPDIPMHIQHSGTYFAEKQGPPSEWVITDKQMEIEYHLDRRADTNQSNPPQTPEEISGVHDLWREFTVENGRAVCDKGF